MDHHHLHCTDQTDGARVPRGTRRAAGLARARFSHSEIWVLVLALPQAGCSAPPLLSPLHKGGTEKFIVLTSKVTGVPCSFSHKFFKGSGSCIIITKKLKQCTQPLTSHGHVNITPLFSFPFCFFPVPDHWPHWCIPAEDGCVFANPLHTLP